MEKFMVGMVGDLPPGKRMIVTLRGRSIGIFNVAGTYYALKNVCPHQGAPLCAGSIVGMTFPSLPNGPDDYLYGREGEILRCPWHGWEFDITNGKSIFNPHKYHVKTYAVTVEDEEDVQVETYPVTIDSGRIMVALE